MLMTNGTILFFLSVAAFGVFAHRLVTAVLQHRLHRAALKAEIELRQRLIDRLDGPEDFREFLELRPLTAVAAPDAEDAYRRIVRSTVAGCVLLIVAVACVGLLALFRAVGSPWMGAPLLFTFTAAGAATGAVALLTAAGISYRLLRGWNLLPPAHRTSVASS